MNTIFLIATLITLILGTILLRFCLYKTNPKIWLLGPGLIIFLFTFTSAGLMVNPDLSATTSTDYSSATVTVEPVSNNVIISNAIHQAIGETSTNDISRIRALDIIVTENGYIILARLNMESNIPKNHIKDSTQINTTNILKALYQGEIPISSVCISGMLPLEDPNGFMRDTEILKASLNSATARDINWDTINHTDLFTQLDYVWWHPSFDN